MKKRVFLFTAVILLIISSIFLSFTIFNESKRQIIKEFDEHQLYVAKDISLDLQTNLNSIARSTEYLSFTKGDLDYKDILNRKDIFKSLYDSFVESISFYDRNGNLICSNGDSITKPGREKINELQNGKYSFIIDDDEKLMGDSGIISNFIIYVPVREIDKSNKRNLNFVLMAFRVNAPKFFRSKILSRNLNEEKFGLWVIDDEQNVLFQSDHPGMESLNISKMTDICLSCHVENLYLNEIIANNEGNLKYSVKNSQPKNASFTAIFLNNEKWKIVVTTPSYEVTKYLTNAAFQTLLLLILIIITMIISAWFIIKFFRRHIKSKEDIKHLSEKNILLNKIIDTEAKYKELFENNPVPLWVYSVDTLKFIMVNDAAINHYGYTREEFLSMTLKDIRPEYEFPRLEANLSQPETDIKISDSWIHRKKDGTLINVEINSHSLPDGAGGHLRLVMAKDVTETRASEEKIKLLAYALESINECITITDLNNVLSYVNGAFCKVYGYGRNELIGKQISNVLTHKDPELTESNIRNCTLSGEWRGELLNRRKNGEEFPVYLSASPIRNNKDEIVALLGVSFDMTDIKQKEEELISAKEKAEEMSRLKSSFLANMSHELRTPMIGMLGFSEILKNELTEKDHKKMADEIYISGQRLMQTLNLVLDLSRIEANKLEIKLRDLNIRDVILKATKIFEPVTRNQNLYLKHKFRNDKIYSILDELLFIGIINNLLTNAIKFTKSGGITIEVDLEEKGRDTWVVINVIDTGIGIPIEYQHVIFHEFRQVSEGMGRKYEGTGLGLTITKKSIELMNGTISVTSEPGKGSVFSVKFPAVVKDVNNLIIINKEVSPVVCQYQSINLPKILLVENDRISVNVTNRALKGICNIDLAEDGETAVEFAGEEKYSAILMDINLGYGISGIEAAHLIRQIEGHKKTPIIALTAFAMKDDKDHFLSVGMTHYLSKPFKLDDLKSLVMEILETKAGSTSSVIDKQL